MLGGALCRWVWLCPPHPGARLGSARICQDLPGRGLRGCPSPLGPCEGVPALLCHPLSPPSGTLKDPSSPQFPCVSRLVTQAKDLIPELCEQMLFHDPEGLFQQGSRKGGSLGSPGVSPLSQSQVPTAYPAPRHSREGRSQCSYQGTFSYFKVIIIIVVVVLPRAVIWDLEHLFVFKKKKSPVLKCCHLGVQLAGQEIQVCALPKSHCHSLLSKQEDIFIYLNTFSELTWVWFFSKE